MRALVFIAVCVAATDAGSLALAQESPLHAELRVEAEHIKEDCSSIKSITSCAATLVTDHPVHVAVGSIAPQNGFGGGPALLLHFTPSESWRNTWTSDAVMSTAGAWRAGTYFKAIHTGVELPRVVAAGTGNARRPITTGKYPVLSVYGQAISLPKLTFYGIGRNSSKDDRTTYAMNESVIGSAAVIPIRKFATRLNLSARGEVNGRLFDIKTGKLSGVASVQSRFTEATAPGLTTDLSFVEFLEGIQIEPRTLDDRLRLNYSFSLQEFVSTRKESSFDRWTVSLGHELPLYRTNAPESRRDANTPNECSISPANHSCPPVTRDRWGTFGFTLFASRSLVEPGSAVPFYLQRTLGGSDLDGNSVLGSYADYRFRGPHLFALREYFEHSVWGPIGIWLAADQATVAAQSEGLSLRDLRRSTTIGATVRAGGFPALRAAWSAGDREGRHFIVTLDTSLLGGGGRPSLQ